MSISPLATSHNNTSQSVDELSSFLPLRLQLVCEKRGGGGGGGDGEGGDGEGRVGGGDENGEGGGGDGGGEGGGGDGGGEGERLLLASTCSSNVIYVPLYHLNDVIGCT